MTRRLIVYAPNVHIGGGVVLLQGLLRAWQRTAPITVFLDIRARDQLEVPKGARVFWVSPTVGSRVRAELSLRGTTRRGDLVLCFHGLPPQLPSTGRVIVFQQNRHHLGWGSLSQFRWRTRVRLAYERIVSHAFRQRVTQYIVQTPTMARALASWYTARPGHRRAAVKVLPFVDTLPAPHPGYQSQFTWDFVYVADGEGHKNHGTLLDAWVLLAQEGFRPSLALTLGPKDRELQIVVEKICTDHSLNIENLGQIPRSHVMEVYSRARALIFPSMSESFGLPLVEASQVGLPILASELDFVRDVCVPAHTFDPTSPVSIARAVKRFSGIQELPPSLRTPTQFWDEILNDNPL